MCNVNPRCENYFFRLNRANTAGYLTNSAGTSIVYLELELELILWQHLQVVDQVVLVVSLLLDAQNCGLRMRRECWERVSDPDMHPVMHAGNAD